ncbi:hypothetical protein [Rummeliibacillus pycnus]|uniref:hypothetical protein n=1 Tax=Rummeliibacillus pycnus TaxID=101070 RepID=UPI003D29880C
MNKKKVKGKIIISSLLGLFLLTSFVLTASAVYSKFDCTYAGISCKGVKVTGYGTVLAHSDYVYASSGKELQVSNSSTGPFNLVTQLVDSSGNAISREVYYSDTIFVKVPKSDNYRVKVTCKDSSSQARCTGQSQVSQ